VGLCVGCVCNKKKKANKVVVDEPNNNGLDSAQHLGTISQRQNTSVELESLDDNEQHLGKKDIKGEDEKDISMNAAQEGGDYDLVIGHSKKPSTSKNNQDVVVSTQRYPK